MCKDLHWPRAGEVMGRLCALMRLALPDENVRSQDAASSARHEGFRPYPASCVCEEIWRPT